MKPQKIWLRDYVLRHKPGSATDKLLAFKAAVAPLERVQIGIRKFNVDDFPVACIIKTS